MGCNMQCLHCGSGCKQPLPDELTTEEALSLCDDIADMGLTWITLSGGEPLIRQDWPQIAKRLSDRGVIPNIISNGWLVTEKTAQSAKESGVGTIAISLDGLEESHDFMRKQGSFKRVLNALRLFSEYGVASGVITTISQKNIPELPALKNLLIEVGVRFWQLQIGLPMGNFRNRPEMIIEPAQVDEVIDFAYETMTEGLINVYPADCLGYYNIKELQVRQSAHNSDTFPLWKGCNAGKRSLGILHNGDILGCTSIRNPEFIEGNIRERSLREIWEDEGSFLWNRNAAKADLEGRCRICQYGDDCLGGCPNTRLTMNERLDSENVYCSYNVAMGRTEEKLSAMNDRERLAELGREFSEKGEFQLAGMALKRALSLEPNDIDLLNQYGYVNFVLNNLDVSLEANKKVLALDPDNLYACKGMGIVLHRSGKTNQGIIYLKKAVSLTDSDYLDPYHDLAVVYLESGRKQEARELLEKARCLSPVFAQQSQMLYESLV